MIRFGASVLLSLCFLCAQTANAGLIINEIMYDLEGADDGREWIEFFNNASLPVDVSLYRFFENDTNHKITIVQGESTIPAYGYALLVDNVENFKKDWPEYTGILFDSAFSLKNSGEYLALKDNSGAIIDEVNYPVALGGNGDGYTLQKINQVWRVSDPSPGRENALINANMAEENISDLTKNQTKPDHDLLSVDSYQSQDKNLDSFMLEYEKNIEDKKIESLSVEIEKESMVTEESTKDNQKSNPKNYWFAMVGVAVLGSLAVLAIRRNGRQMNPGDDFEILEE